MKGLLSCVIMMYRVTESKKITRNYIKGSMILSLYTYFTNSVYPFKLPKCRLIKCSYIQYLAIVFDKIHLKTPPKTTQI